MDAATSDLVKRRAGNRCEYCRLPQECSGLHFHIEHITARQHGGSNHPENLALACPECNFHKGTNLTGIDPDTNQVTAIFRPRQDRWHDHFFLAGANIIGKTPVGRTSVWLLDMNSTHRVETRKILLQFGLFK
jgi:hypothetical protein